MMKNWEINGTEEIGFVTPTPESLSIDCRVPEEIMTPQWSQPHTF